MYKYMLAAKRENMWDIFRKTHNDLCNYKLQNILASTPPKKNRNKKSTLSSALFFYQPV